MRVFHTCYGTLLQPHVLSYALFHTLRYSLREGFFVCAVCIISLSLLFMLPAFVQSQPILTLRSSYDLLPLGGSVAVFEDKSRLLSIDNVSSPSLANRFQPSTQALPNFAFTSSAIWLRFSVVNKSGDKCFLQIYNAPLDTLDVYVSDVHGGFIHKRYGAGLMGTREVTMTYPVLSLPTTPDSTHVVYVRAVSYGVMYFASHVGGTAGVMDANFYFTCFNALSFGILAVMILYNLFVFVAVRRFSYLLYVLYCCATVLFFAYQKGYLFLLLGEQIASALYRFPATPNIVVLLPASLICLFASRFLFTRVNAPRLHRLLYVLVALNMTNIVLECTTEWILARKVLSFLVMLSTLTTLVSAIVVYRQGYSSAKFFLAGWSIWLVCTIIYALMVENIIVTTRAIELVLQIGASTEVVLMSFALADRINVLQAENGRLVREQNAMLEAKVHERTKALEESNSQLSDANAEIHRQIEIQDELTREIELTNNELQISSETIEERNQRLTLLNKEKNDILGMVSHDLRNPLMTILGLSEMMKTPSYDFSVEYQHTLAAQIYQAGIRMNSLIKALLDVDAIESGKLRIHSITLDAVSVVKIVLRDFQERAAAKKITLHYNGVETAVVLADEALLYQIIENLVSNAIKYSPHGCSVWVVVKEQRTKSKENRSVLESVPCCLIFVNDEGPGINAEDQKSLFGKFARLSAKPTGGETSIGLGLSIVKKLVEAMNGQVWCESIPETGSPGAKFVVALPAAHENYSSDGLQTHDFMQSEREA